jgi:DNA-binding protein H-NS
MTALDSKHEDKCDDWITNLSVTQRRELLFSEFKRKSRIRALFKDCPVPDMTEMLDRFTAVLDERVQEENEKAAKEAELQEHAKSILDDMAKKGIDIDKLKEIQQGANAFGGSKAKYLKDGVTWTGQGRRPQPFKGLSDLELEKHRVPVSRHDEK